jgi:autotransporter-associated beta strand protein
MWYHRAFLRKPLVKLSIAKLALITLLTFDCALMPAHGAPKFWDGSSGGNWSVGANWSDGIAPAAGDDLIFPTGVAQLLTTNNFSPNRGFNSITFQGSNYIVRAIVGNTITVTNGIDVLNPVGQNDINAPILLGGSQAFTVNSAAASLDINASITLGAFNLTFTGAGDFFSSSAIMGSGAVSKTGLGTLRYDGTAANTYSGLTTVNGGTLELIKRFFDGTNFVGVTAVPGDLTIGSADTVLLLENDQIENTSDVTINNGTLDLNNSSDAIGALTMTAGTVDSGTGTLTLGGNLTTLASSATATIAGNLSLGTFSRIFNIANGTASTDLSLTANLSGGFTGFFIFAGFTKIGDGLMTLSGNNTYGGPTVLADGSVIVGSDTAFGSTFNGVTLTNQGFMSLSASHIGNEALVVNRAGGVMSASGVSSWSGPITLNSNTITVTTGGTLAFSNSISGPGGITLASSSASAVFRFAGTNDNNYTGPTFLADGTLELAKTANAIAINSGSSLEIGDGDFADEVMYLAVNQIFTTVPITLVGSGTLNLNNFNDDVGTLTFTGGTVMTGTGTITPDNITVNATDATALISGELNLVGARTWNVADGLPYCDLNVTAVIGSSGSLTKTGAGTVCLGGANTYTGATTVNAGRIEMNNTLALGASTAGTTVNSNATVRLGIAVATFGEPFTIAGSGIAGTNGAISVTGGATHTNTITLNGSATIFVETSSLLTHTGTIVGTGDLTKDGPGTMTMSGTGGNTFVGTTIVPEGVLNIGKNGGAVPDDLRIGVNSLLAAGSATVHHTSGSQIGGSVTVLGSGLWDLDGTFETITSLTLSGGGDADTGTGGTIDLLSGGDVTASPATLGGAATISGAGALDLSGGTHTFSVSEGGLVIGDAADLIISARISGAGNLEKTGAGDLSLTVSNNLTGNILVQDGELLISHGQALGGPTSDTFVSGDAQLGVIGNIDVFGELVLSGTGQGTEGILVNRGGTNTWNSNISLVDPAVVNVFTNSALVINSAIHGVAGLTKIGPGRLEYRGAAANTYSGETRVLEGRLLSAKTAANGGVQGNLFIGDGIGGTSSDVFEILVGFQVANTARVTIATSGLLDISATPINELIGGLSGSGRIDLGTRNLDVSEETTSSYSGLIFGAGGSFRMSGNGSLTLAANNTYSGLTEVADGTLLVNGNQPASPVRVSAAALLGGDGTVGNVTNLGTISPGNSPAVLTTSNVVFQAGSDVSFELNGLAPGTGYDQISARGLVSLGGATLNLSVGFPVAEGDEFVIINNDAADAVVGTFAGLPNGSIVTANGIPFRIRYFDAFNNDVVLTATNLALELIATPTLGTGNGNGAVDPNECNELTIPLRNNSGGVVSGVSGLLSTETPGVVITQPYSTYPNIPNAASRNNDVPFQFFTTPSFVCGTNIDFVLTVATATNGTFEVRFSLPSGEPDAGTRFNSALVQAIPDAGTLNSTINVAGITTPIKRVSVLLHITHTAANDLDISLIGPDGTTIVLSSDNGGVASDYGADCTDAGRTTFIDTAPTAITSGAAPFVGRFRPEQALTAFNEKTGADVNGIWTLRVADDTAGAVGSLRCWSLVINGTTCTPGSGACETCGGTFFGSIAPGDATQTDRIFRTGVPSNCSSNKPCPGPFVAGAIRYDAYTFTNGPSPACVTVTLAPECGGGSIFSAAYLGSYTPGDFCLNYLADIAQSPGASGSYSFNVPASATFVVIVNEVTSGTGCASYALAVNWDCPPRLQIEPVAPNRVALRWSTASVGYDLLSANDLDGPGPHFSTLGATPFVVDGKYSVTNTTSGAKRFYELRKP